MEQNERYGQVIYLDPLRLKRQATYEPWPRMVADPRACVDCWQAGFHRVHGSYEVCPNRQVR